MPCFRLASSRPPSVRPISAAGWGGGIASCVCEGGLGVGGGVAVAGNGGQMRTGPCRLQPHPPQPLAGQARGQPLRYAGHEAERVRRTQGGRSGAAPTCGAVAEVGFVEGAHILINDLQWVEMGRGGWELGRRPASGSVTAAGGRRGGAPAGLAAGAGQQSEVATHPHTHPPGAG